MTFTQLRIVLSAAGCGSISNAAKELKISQPNASNSIRLLEDEIGFPIFHRGCSGIALTPKGEQFLIHAQQILEQNGKILNLRNAEEIYRLRVGGVNYNTCIEPFLALCREHRDDVEADFQYFNVSVEEGIAKLARREIDVVIAPILKHQITSMMNECKHNNIVFHEICDIPAVVNVRKGHPATEDGRCENLTQGSDAMKEFPYVAYRNLTEDSGTIGYNDSDFVQCSYIMYVDDVDVRLRVVAATNGFSFGARSSAGLMERYGLVAFPVPGILLKAFVLTRPMDLERREIQDYLSHLRVELRSVMV